MSEMSAETLSKKIGQNGHGYVNTRAVAVFFLRFLEKGHLQKMGQMIRYEYDGNEKNLCTERSLLFTLIKNCRQKDWGGDGKNA